MNTIRLTDEDFDVLIWALGVAAGASSKADNRENFLRVMVLTNSIASQGRIWQMEPGEGKR